MRNFVLATSLIALLVSMTILALLMVSAGLSADSKTVTLDPGYNCITTSMVPLHPCPIELFSGLDIGGGKLRRWDAPTQSEAIYSPKSTGFGCVLMGDGLWLKCTAPTSWTYECGPDGLSVDETDWADYWISLPQAGFTLFGHPFNHSVLLRDCDVTDGNDTLSFSDAALAGWIQGYCWGWDAPLQSRFKVVPSGKTGSLILEPNHGYQLRSFRQKLALIVPAYPKTP